MREFYDRQGPYKGTTLPMKQLSAAERAMVHRYAEELGLGHDSKGSEPNRYLELSRPETEEDKVVSSSGEETGVAEDDAEGDDGVSADKQRRDALSAAVSSRYRAKQDAAAQAMKKDDVSEEKL